MACKGHQPKASFKIRLSSGKRSMQAFYVGKQYRRALALLKDSELVEADIRCRYLAARCLAAVQDWDECLSIMGIMNDPSDADMLGLQVRSTPMLPP